MAKVALITGGSRGIGLGIAEALAKQGYNLAINGVRNEAETEEQLKPLKRLVEVVYCQGNIGNLNEHQHIVATALSRFKTIPALKGQLGNLSPIGALDRENGAKPLTDTGPCPFDLSESWRKRRY